ncbi:ankyrin [Polyplosphaeria fusca]|uniref:Ankyrin n=1 Tax=Polyplosphaeria fusca TaxID=682080 RepID=A0A9P4QT49_9PLEO|nr:ankyrin [Polyplosphaeria fusca]
MPKQYLRKKRVLDYFKCRFCRQDKAKCEPSSSHSFEKRCKRCIQRNLQCSELLLAKEQRCSSISTQPFENIPQIEPSFLSQSETLGPMYTLEAEETPFLPSTFMWNAPEQSTAHIIQGEIEHKGLLLYSVRIMASMATEELRALAQGMILSIDESTVWQCYANSFNAVLLKYVEFSKLVTDELLRNYLGVPLLLDATLSPSQPDRMMLLQSATIDETVGAISERSLMFQKAGHHGLAYCLQVQAFMDNPDMLTEGEIQRFRFNQDHFLSDLRTARILDDSKLSSSIPKAMRHYPLFIPSKLLRHKAFAEHVFNSIEQDCLGRTFYLMASDGNGGYDLSPSDGSHQDVLGRSTLYKACRDGIHTLANSLLLAGAAIDQSTVAGATPLHIAATMGHASICQMILNIRHPDTNVCVTRQPFARDSVGRTALACAAQHGHAGLVDRLCYLMKGVDKDTDDFGRSNVTLAVLSGNEDAVKHLLAHQFAADVPDRMGRTPFWYAVEKQNFDIMHRLVQHNRINVHQGDKNNCTPLAKARQLGFTEGIDFIRGRSMLFNNEPYSTQIPADKRGAPLVKAAEACSRTQVPYFRNHLAILRNQYQRSTKEDTTKNTPH